MSLVPSAIRQVQPQADLPNAEDIMRGEKDRLAKARMRHADGSPVNICRECAYFYQANIRVMLGKCTGDDADVMEFYNCDEWRPI